MTTAPDTYSVNWSYPTSVRFGPGRIKELARACEVAGIEKPLFVTDAGLKQLPITRDALALLPGAGFFADVKANPVDANVEAGVAARRPGGFGAYEEEHRLVPRRRRNLGRRVEAEAVPAGSGESRVTEGSTGRARRSAGRSRSSVRADLRAVEREQAALRSEIEETEAAIAGTPGDHGRLRELMTRLADATAAAETADERWLELAAEAEDRGFDLGA